MARGDKEKKEETKVARPMVETWRKVTGKHHARIDGQKVVILPGMTMDFPVGMGPGARGDTTWALAVAAAPNPLASMKVVRRGKNSNWYDVIRADTGAKVNAKAMKIDEALSLANTDHVEGEETSGQ